MCGLHDLSSVSVITLVLVDPHRYQEWYVWPNKRWGELHVQNWSAQWERPMSAASDIVLGSEVGQREAPAD
jgi:hypothetical protein